MTRVDGPLLDGRFYTAETARAGLDSIADTGKADLRFVDGGWIISTSDDDPQDAVDRVLLASETALVAALRALMVPHG